MDMITGSIIGASIVAAVNLGIFQLNRYKDEKKERLQNLYYPLQAIIDKKYKTVQLMKRHFSQDFESFSVAYYKFFLELRDTYLDNRVYATKELNIAFHKILHNHEIESLNYSDWTSNADDLLKDLALFELKHQKNDEDMSELERNVEKVIEMINKDISKLSSLI